MDTTTRLREWLFSLKVAFEEVQHAPTRTSEESAAARGESLRIGGKALVVKTGEQFRLLVLPADRKLDSSRLRRELKVSAVRFATKEELFALTGLVPGSVPPFGRPIFELELCVDRVLTQNERIAFNAGSLTQSFVMSMADYLRAAAPVVMEFSAPGA